VWIPIRIILTGEYNSPIPMEHQTATACSSHATITSSATTSCSSHATSASNVTTTCLGIAMSASIATMAG